MPWNPLSLILSVQVLVLIDKNKQLMCLLDAQRIEVSTLDERDQFCIGDTYCFHALAQQLRGGVNNQEPIGSPSPIFQSI